MIVKKDVVAKMVEKEMGGRRGKKLVSKFARYANAYMSKAFPSTHKDEKLSPLCALT